MTNKDFDIFKIPVRTDYEVLPADDPNKPKLGLPVFLYSGDCVCFLNSKIPICEKDSLCVGMEVTVWDFNWKVVNDEKFSICLDREHSIGIIEFSKDDRKCWTCPSIVIKNSPWYKNK